MPPTETVILRESGHVTVERQAMESATGLSIDALAEAVRPLVDLAPDWEAARVRLAAGQTIGTVHVGGLRVEVRPRLAAQEAVTLIRYAFGGHVMPTLKAAFPTGASAGLDELIGQVLAEEADHIRQVGLSRQYRQRHERLAALRGRPDFLGSFPWDPKRAASIVCSYHLLTCDNLDNQLLRAALEQACRLDVCGRTRSRLLAHRHVWTTAASPVWPTREDFDQARAKYTRLSEHYRLAHNLAELVVMRRRPVELFRSGQTTMSGLTLSMPVLFEKFVERLMGELFSRSGMVVTPQQPDQGALLDGQSKVYRRVRPDLVLYQDGRPVMVIDAKYKEYWPAEAAGVPTRRISNEDIYQLFFYAQRLQVRHGLSRPPAACIVAPLPAEDERQGRLEVDDRYRRILWRAGHERSGDIRLLNLPLTAILRGMEERKDWIGELDPLKARLRIAFVSQTEQPAGAVL